MKLLSSIVLALCLSTGVYASELDDLIKAAEQGDVESQIDLGVMYLEGEGVPQNYKEAFKWFTLAAEQGDADAQIARGFMYRGGVGVPQNYKEAFKWFTLAAEQGEPYAQMELGSMYSNGKGVPQNQILAYVWFNLASINRSLSEARENRDSVAEKLSYEELIEAQELSQEYFERIRSSENFSEQAAVDSDKQQPQRDLVRLRKLYFNSIQQRVERYFRKPSGMTSEVDCTISVLQSVGGEVLKVVVEKCTDNSAALRKSVENAVRAASPLPAAPDPKLFDRRVRFYFRPS